ncbi:MAG: hypothetical protein BGN92_11615 [Sphingobacteriales bacterium 41-5]|nr:MAG: hypothetical protein BGN92_11615 [Sphingobacteriales bacterium 41-5]
MTLKIPLGLEISETKFEIQSGESRIFCSVLLSNVYDLITVLYYDCKYQNLQHETKHGNFF